MSLFRIYEDGALFYHPQQICTRVVKQLEMIFQKYGLQRQTQTPNTRAKQAKAAPNTDI